MKEQIDFICYLVGKEGPTTDGDYRGYGKLVMGLSAALSSGEITRNEFGDKYFMLIPET
jgi:hypothetical protein